MVKPAIMHKAEFSFGAPLAFPRCGSYAAGYYDTAQTPVDAEVTCPDCLHMMAVDVGGFLLQLAEPK